MFVPDNFAPFRAFTDAVFAEEKKRLIIQLRWVVILASFALLVSARDLPGEPLVYGFVLVHILTNAALYFVTQETIVSRGVFSSLILFDTLALSLSLVVTNNLGTDLYLCYFLVILIAAFWQDIRWSIAFAFVVSVMYGSLLFIAEHHDSELLLRIPFLLIASLFYGYFTQLMRWERSRRETAESEAKRDFLTGLANRKAFDEKLRVEEDRSQRYGRPLSLLMIDVDNFKAVNDSLGHDWGDIVLRMVAQSIATGIRQTDFAARYGGEEFVLILPETDIHDAILLGDRIRLAVRENPIATPRGSLIITVSIGASSSRSSVGERSLGSDADKALYLAKRNGKDRVECLGDIAESRL